MAAVMSEVKTVVVYKRVSSENQVDGFGLESQERVCRDYCAKNEMNVSRVFHDDMTGKSDGDDRPGWSSLLAYCEENAVTTIVIPKIDRLARDLLVQEAIIADMMKRGWTLVSIAEPDLCGNDPSRKLIRRFVGAVAEYERDVIEYRMKNGRIERVLAGDRGVGGVPYGYRSVEVDGLKRKVRRTIVKEDEAAIVREIFAMRCSGKSLAAIADVLNDRGVASPSKRASTSGRWHATSVQTIVGNAIYFGKVEMAVEGKAVSSINPNLAIVDEKTWKCAQRKS
jgi:DNA invertase Pin-like site-specific DNA recombinase